MSVSRFKVQGRFDGAYSATVEINRDTNLIAVRPHRRKRKYELPLSDVAESILWRVIKAEIQEKKKAKKLRVRRGLL